MYIALQENKKVHEKKRTKHKLILITLLNSGMSGSDTRIPSTGTFAGKTSFYDFSLPRHLFF